MAQTCKTCQWFNPVDCGAAVIRTGDCHRYPPATNGWARVNDDDWCGEHRLSHQIWLEKQGHLADKRPGGINYREDA